VEGRMKSIEWADNKVKMIDQRKLPLKDEYIICNDYKCVAKAIKSMVIRGAPAIGVAAAYGFALAGLSSKAKTSKALLDDLKVAHSHLSEARPTAVNLFWALSRMMNIAINNIDMSVNKLKDRLIEEATIIKSEDIAINEKIGQYGSALFNKKVSVLTHCNTGALATGGYGTALGIVRSLNKQGKIKRVWVDETRPFLQGARLTTYELKKEGIEHILITDNMAGYFINKGDVDAVLVGADRIAANGDTANKIGTYSLAVLAKENKVPFYVVAPTSTIDMNINSGGDIPIEERDKREVLFIGESRIAPSRTKVKNPAFDITPARYITAIITELGVINSPYDINLKNKLLLNKRN